MNPIHAPEWQAHTACTPDDTDLFYPDSAESPAAYAAAREICAACPVRTDCLEWAMELGDPHGMWGGLTGRERQRLAQQRGTTMQQLRNQHRIDQQNTEILIEWRAGQAAGKSASQLGHRHGISAAAYLKRVQRAQEATAAAGVA
jgi:WhiB family redox-sensing transcriptional regulator